MTDINGIIDSGSQFLNIPEAGDFDLALFDDINAVPLGPDGSPIAFHEEEKKDIDFKKVRRMAKKMIGPSLIAYRGVFQVCLLSRKWNGKYYKIRKEFLDLKDDKEFINAVCDWAEENELVAELLSCMPASFYIIYSIAAATAMNIVEIPKEENEEIHRKLTDKLDEHSGMGLGKRPLEDPQMPPEKERDPNRELSHDELKKMKGGTSMGFVNL